MMRTTTSLLISVFAFSGAGPVLAQNRAHLPYSNDLSSITGRAATVMASMRISLDAKQKERDNDPPVTFDLVAGQTLRLSNGNSLANNRTITGEVIKLSLSPKHSYQLSVNGTPLATSYFNTIVAKANDDSNDKGPNWLLITGGVLLVGLGITYLAFEDAVDCTENGNNVCE
jgi:hypothetical protein